jgi:hypothetical protein
MSPLSGDKSLAFCTEQQRDKNPGGWLKAIVHDDQFPEPKPSFRFDAACCSVLRT